MVIIVQYLAKLKIHITNDESANVKLASIDYESTISRDPKNLTSYDLQMIIYNVRRLNNRVKNYISPFNEYSI